MYTFLPPPRSGHIEHTAHRAIKIRFTTGAALRFVRGFFRTGTLSRTVRWLDDNNVNSWHFVDNGQVARSGRLSPNPGSIFFAKALSIWLTTNVMPGGAKWTTFTNPGRSGTVGGAFNFLKSGHRAAALRRRGRRRRLSTEIV